MYLVVWTNLHTEHTNSSCVNSVRDSLDSIFASLSLTQECFWLLQQILFINEIISSLFVCKLGVVDGVTMSSDLDLRRSARFSW
ncbi:hypothetical protein RJT34_30020 [Clitoria ternatea]|uniref:Uncharacterized protein n=1 Tax=Clitoria ternatea TaxID=43366 RepID=A0AAN9I1L9_CLITE